MMNDIFNYGLLVFTSFFTLLNPIGTMPVLLGLTKDLEEKQRFLIVKRAVIATLILIFVFAFTGQFMFKFFGISVNSLRIVGGAIFFVMGFDMLNARLSGMKVKETEVKQYVKDISITPLAIPMLCGPGTITNAIVLMEDATTWIYKLIFVLTVTITVGFTFLILASSTKLVKILGETGINVMLRIMGLIVMVIAVEFFLAGIKPFLIDVLTTK